jgi:hypothetical protein
MKLKYSVSELTKRATNRLEFSEARIVAAAILFLFDHLDGSDTVYTKFGSILADSMGEYERDDKA